MKRICGDDRQTTTSEAVSTTFVSTYGRYLQEYYENGPTLGDYDELSTAPHNRITFIDLVLVKKVERASDKACVPSVANSLSATTNRPIPGHTDPDTRLAADPSAQLKIDEVLELDSDVKFVLVEGAPGIGKTFFCSELYRKWATLQSLQEYKIALHLKLRQELVQTAKSLSDILQFFHVNREFCARVEKEILRSDGKDVLFILDGFDEMPSSVMQVKNCFIMKVIRGQCGISKATRVVTSRPSALHDKDRYFPRKRTHLEILGFTKERILQYAKSALESDPAFEHFKQFLNSSSRNAIYSLMHSPVVCAIVLSIYRSGFVKKLMSKTMTQLYQTLLQVLIRRDMIKRGEWNEDTPVPSFESLPSEVPDLKKVCKLAFDGLFSEKVQIEFTVLDADFQSFGLLTGIRERDMYRGLKTIYSFLHLSIQEFLAALYVSWNTQPGFVSKVVSEAFVDASQIDFLYALEQAGLSGMIMKLYMYNFGLFLAGMIGCSSFPPCSNLYALYCLFEAQRVEITFAEKISGGLISLSSPREMYIFGYALVNISAVWDIMFSSCSFDTLVSSLTDYAQPGGKVPIGTIAKLTAGLDHLSTSPTFLHLLQSVRSLRLYDCDSPGKLLEILPALQSLEAITLSMKYHHDNSLVYRALSKGFYHLRDLELYFDHIDHKDLDPLVETLQSRPFESLCFSFGRSYQYKLFTPAREVDCNRLIVAALSLPTLKSLSVTNVFFTLKKNDIPKNLKCVHFNFSIRVYFHSYSLIDSLYSTVDMCAVPSLIQKFEFDFPPFCRCSLFSFLANLNSCFESNISLQVQWGVLHYIPFIGPCDCKHLSHALRQDPAIARHSLRRSLDDLKCITSKPTEAAAVRAYSGHIARRAPDLFCITRRPLSDHHHSCPDLLELQSLRKLHPRMIEGLSKFATWLRPIDETYDPH